MRKVIFKAPSRDPEVKFIEDSLESLQKLVMGYIECVPLSGDLTLVCNEEGKLLRLPPNFSLRHLGDVVMGNVLIVAYDEEGDLRDLTEEEECEALDFLRKNSI